MSGHSHAFTEPGYMMADVASDLDSIGSGVKDRTKLSPEMRTAATVLLSIVIIFTSGGNLLTIIVMKVDRRLRSKPVSSMYIASLAGADLLVGAVVMTMMMLYTVTFDGQWVFGSIACTVWTCVDYVSCTASLTNVWLIAVDRYRSVSQPLKAIRRRSRRKAAWGVFGAWLVPTVFWVSVIVSVKMSQSGVDSYVRADRFRSTEVGYGDNATRAYSAVRDVDKQFRWHKYSDRESIQTTWPTNAGYKRTNVARNMMHDDLDALTSKCDTDWQPPEVIVVSVIMMFYVPLAAIFVLFVLIMCVLHRHIVTFTGRMRTATASFVADQSNSSEPTKTGLIAAGGGQSPVGRAINSPPRTVATIEHRYRPRQYQTLDERSSPSSRERDNVRSMSTGFSSSFKTEVVSEIVYGAVVVRVASLSVNGQLTATQTTNRNRVSCNDSSCHSDSSPMLDDVTRTCSVLSNAGTEDCHRIGRTGGRNRRRLTESIEPVQLSTPKNGTSEAAELPAACRTTSFSQPSPAGLSLCQDGRHQSDVGASKLQPSSSTAAVAMTTATERSLVDETTPKWRQYASQLRANRQEGMLETRLRCQVKAARTLGAITGVLLVCWLPFTVMVAMRAFCPRCLNQRTFDIASWINYINSAANPIIYGLCNSEYRLAIRTLLRRMAGFCCCCCGQWCRKLVNRSNRYDPSQ